MSLPDSPLRVAGADPGTSGLDLLILQNGAVAEQVRFSPQELQADPARPVHWLEERGPFDLIAGPSGYGLPLVPAAELTDHHLDLMTLVRPDDRGEAQGVLGFTGLLRALRASTLPVVFLPGVLHLPTVPVHRKINRIDLGTPDKLCVAALALAQHAVLPRATFCVVELGSAFTACVVVEQGQIVDGAGGTAGAVGWMSGGAWDGEFAYLLSPLHKRDLFRGGVRDLPGGQGMQVFRESLLKTIAGLQAVTPFTEIVLAGRLLEHETTLATGVVADLGRLGRVIPLEGLAGAWVKHAAQGAALLADGLAGGHHAPLVEQLLLTEAWGSVLSWLHHPAVANATGWLRPSVPGTSP